MDGQLTLCFSGPDPSPDATAPGVAETQDRGSSGGSSRPPRVGAGGAPTRNAPADTGLPALRLHAGYELYRDSTRTVIRRPGEARWGATVRTGPTTHRFVGAGPDPAALWSLAAREAARGPAEPGLPRA